jgi:acylphosphatase/uncharacterized protein YoxC
LVKARLIIKGNVQGVGYRAFVKLFASRLGIKGLVRNLDDGNVEVFVDGSKKAINEFLKKIDVKGKAEDPLSPHVNEINVYWEGKHGYKGAWKDYVGFDYGIKKLSLAEREMLESLEWSKLHFVSMSRIFREEIDGAKQEIKGVKEETKGMRGEIKDMHADIKNVNSGIKSLHSEIKGMRKDVNKSFQEMAKRYDTISLELVRTREELKRAIDGLLKLIDEFIKERR